MVPGADTPGIGLFCRSRGMNIASLQFGTTVHFDDLGIPSVETRPSPTRCMAEEAAPRDRLAGVGASPS
jgi:hypothetical protein